MERVNIQPNNQFTQSVSNTNNSGGSMSLWSSAKSASGPKKGDAIVARLNVAVATARLSDSDLRLIIDNFKSIPLKTRSEVEKQMKINNDLRDEKFRGYNFSNTKPTMKTNESVERIIAITALIRGNLVNPDDLTAGSLVQCDVFKPFLAEVSIDITMTMPSVRKYVMSKFIPNALNFKLMSETMLLRIKCANRALSAFKAFSSLQKSGTTVENGMRTTTDALKYDLKSRSITTEKQYMIGEEGYLRESDTIEYNVNAANYPDLHLLLQTQEVKMNKRNAGAVKPYLDIIANNMGNMIAISGASFSGVADLTPKSPFCDMYFARLRFLRASLNNLRRSLWGSGGGADTRTILKSYATNIDVKAMSNINNII